MNKVPLKEDEDIRIYNMVDMGLRYSGMIRLYQRGSKQKLIRKIMKMLPEISDIDSKTDFDKIHHAFCMWAKRNISLARPRQTRANISFGQAAKTLDVTLKVLVYYCSWPNRVKSSRLVKWIHAAVDTDMMRYLKKYYRSEFTLWPKTVKQVDKRSYNKIQDLVKRFVAQKDNTISLPVQFDDKYWYLLKEGYAR